MHNGHIKSLSQWMSQIWLQMWSNNAYGYYEHVCKCIVEYTHQSKFNWIHWLWLEFFLPLQINAYTHVDHVCKILAL